MSDDGSGNEDRPGLTSRLGAGQDPASEGVAGGLSESCNRRL